MKFTKVSSPAQKKITMSSFLGIDLRNAPYNVSEGRSPNCPNMIRDTRGVNKKRFGYETLLEFDGPINGSHVLKGETNKLVVHAGTKFYSVVGTTKTEIYSTAANHRSISKQINSKLYILDGSNYLVYDGEAMKKVSEDAYIPTIIIARLYNGGGEVLEPINLLQPKGQNDSRATIQIKHFS